MKLNKRFLILFIILLLNSNFAKALELDLSVDEEIRKKYNSTKLEYEVLPNLPKSATPSMTTKKTNITYSTTPPTITKINKKDGKKIPSGTKFQTRSNQTVADWTSEGSIITFTTTAPIYKKNITIPSGIKIYGKVVDSHSPQITGNGGLVVIDITGISNNGKTYELDGKITKANSKKIFFNNIKGKRQYWTNVGKHINKGENFYKKSRNIASKMADNPILIILSPIPNMVGMIGYTTCTILSPITALGTKGNSLSIPAGSNFEIKLLDPAYIQ